MEELKQALDAAVTAERKQMHELAEATKVRKQAEQALAEAEQKARQAEGTGSR